ELVADIVGFARDLVAERCHRLAQLLVLGVADRQRDLFGLVGAVHGGGAYCLFVFGGGGERGGGEGAGLLRVIGRCVGEPAVELVGLVANERVVDHAKYLLDAQSAPVGLTDSENGRAFTSAGTRPRASATALRSRSATSTPGPSPPSWP